MGLPLLHHRIGDLETHEHDKAMCHNLHHRIGDLENRANNALRLLILHHRIGDLENADSTYALTL